MHRRENKQGLHRELDTFFQIYVVEFLAETAFVPVREDCQFLLPNYFDSSDDPGTEYHWYIYDNRPVASLHHFEYGERGL